MYSKRQHAVMEIKTTNSKYVPTIKIDITQNGEGLTNSMLNFVFLMNMETLIS